MVIGNFVEFALDSIKWIHLVQVSKTISLKCCLFWRFVSEENIETEVPRADSARFSTVTYDLVFYQK